MPIFLIFTSPYSDKRFCDLDRECLKLMYVFQILFMYFSVIVKISKAKVE